jgi:uncharacterized protein YdiU (UPF0061 family)
MPEWDDDDTDQNDSDLVKQLRKQLNDYKKRNVDLDTELSTLRPQVRKSSLSGVLSEIGVNTKIAALMPDSVEPTKEAVAKWLEDYGDLFNLPKAEEKPEGDAAKAVAPLAGQESQVVDQSIQDQWARIQSGSAAAGTTTPDIEKQQQAQLGEAMAKSNGSFDQFVALLRNEPLSPM